MTLHFSRDDLFGMLRLRSMTTAVACLIFASRIAVGPAGIHADLDAGPVGVRQG